MRFVRRLLGSPDVLTPMDLDRIFASRGIAPRVLLEVGANDGTDTLKMSQIFTAAKIYCFEPEPRAIYEFKRRVRGPNVVLHEVALGAESGVIPFYRSSGTPPGRQQDFPQGWHYSGSIRRPSGHLEVHPWCSFNEVLQVQIWTLDDWFEAAAESHIDFIWADVQGAEVDLVRGGKNALAHTRFLYTEFSEDELYEGQVGLQALMELLPGWRIHTKYANDVLLENCNRLV